MANPAAVLGNYHSCPAYDSDHPHTGGAVMSGSPNIFIGGIQACRVGDSLLCSSPSTDTVTGGSTTVFFNGMGAARIYDPCQHGGMLQEGIPSVLIG